MHLYRRNKIYYYRIKIPKDLKPFFKKQEIHKSLKTINKLIAYKYVKILQTHFEFIKKGIQMEKFTSTQLHTAVSNFITLKFEETENELYNHPNPQETLSWQKGEWHAGITQLNKQLLNQEYDQSIKDQAKIIITKLEYSYSNEEFNQLCRHLIEGHIQSLQVFISKIETKTYSSHKNPYTPDFITESLETPPSLFPTQVNHIGNRNNIQDPISIETLPIAKNIVTIECAFDMYYNRYIKLKQRSKDTLSKLLNVKKLLLLNFSSDMDIKKVTEDDLLEFRNKLTQLPKRYTLHAKTKNLTNLDNIISVGYTINIEPIDSKTINMHLQYLSSFWEYCSTNQRLIDFNPHQDLHIDGSSSKDKKRTAYTSKELSLIFSSPFYTESLNTEIITNPEHIFIPLLALYQGARLNELCQLYKEDIKQVDGIWSIDLNREKDKSIKNDNSVRVIPIHPKIIESGFIDYVQSIKTDRLWPNLKKALTHELKTGETEASAKGTFSKDFSKWFRVHLNRKYVTKGSDKVFHSLRHNIIHNFRDLGISGEHPPALLGHLSEHEMTFVTYGKNIPVEFLLETLKKVNYDVYSIEVAIKRVKKAVSKFYN